MKRQNRKKNGGSFTLPDKIIGVLASIRAVFDTSFRSLVSYMRIFWRIRRIKVPEIINPSSSVVIDFIGLKTTIRGIGYPINGQRKGMDGSSFMSRRTQKGSWSPEYHYSRRKAIMPLSSAS